VIRGRPNVKFASHLASVASFKQAVGVGPQRYVMQRRLERAKTLMRRSNQPLAMIAQEAGSTDQSHLTAIFRRETGATPSRYRAALA
jgi:AraC family transcriptional regulator